MSAIEPDGETPKRASSPTDPIRRALGPLGFGGGAWLALACFALLTSAYLWSTVRGLSDSLGPDRGDPLLLLVLLKWGAFQVAHGLPDFWNAPFFFPTPGVTTLSDHMLGPATQLYLFTRLWPNPIAGYNLLFLTAFVLSGFAVWWVLRRTGRSWGAALFGGIAFAFCAHRFDEAYHLQVLLAQWLPLLLWSWDRLLQRASLRRAAAFLLFFALHVTGGSYLAYMAFVPLAALALCRRRTVYEQLRISRQARAILAALVLLCAVGSIALFAPYWQFARQLGLHRGSSEYNFYGATLASYLSPSPASWYTLPLFSGWARAENALFAGFLVLALGFWGARARWRELAPPAPPTPLQPLAPERRAALAAALVMAGFGFALGEWRTWTGAERLDLPLIGMSLRNDTRPAVLFALGLGLWAWLRHRWGRPALPRLALDPFERGLLWSGLAAFLLTFPIVFTPLATVVPGLGGLRVPARFVTVVSLALALLAAIGFDALLSRLPTSRRRAVVGAALLAGLAIELAPRPFPWTPLASESELPAVDQWIARAPAVRAYVDLPLAPQGEEWQEIQAMYRASLHWKPIANGFSGYLTPSYLELREAIQLVPNRAALELMRRVGLTHVVVRGSEIARHGRPRVQYRRWLERLGKPGGPDLERVFADGDDGVYRILPRSSEPPTAAAAPRPDAAASRSRGPRRAGKDRP